MFGHHNWVLDEPLPSAACSQVAKSLEDTIVEKMWDREIVQKWDDFAQVFFSF